MIFLANGKTGFNDVYEMYFNLFSEIGLSINRDQYLYDQDTLIPIKYKDKYIKATVQPVPIYAGRNDIVFAPESNYNLMVSLFGYYIDKENADGLKIDYVAQYVEDDELKEKQRLVLQLRNGIITSQYYYNVYLAYIELIFLLGGNFEPDLSNFDIKLEV